MDLVSQPGELSEIVHALESSSVFYIDTEFESSKRGKTLSLIQVSADDLPPYLIDALALQDLSPLAEVLMGPASTWVMHAGLQDVELLLERFARAEPPALFDTQVAWALQGPEFSVSLSYLKYRLLGLKTMKTHQADDWMRRPLPRAQLTYAAEDIEHLPEIHRMLLQRLAERDRAGVVLEASREQLLPPAPTEDDLSLSSFRNAWQLEPKNQAALLFLIDWYKGLPDNQRRAAPSPKTLMSIASRLPKTGRDLARIKGISERWCAREGNRLIRDLSRAIDRARSGDFEPIAPPPYATFADIRLDGWLAMMRSEVSADAEVAPELAFPSRVMKALRRRIAETGDVQSGVDVLSGWRAEVLGPAYRSLCERWAGVVAGREPA